MIHELVLRHLGRVMERRHEDRNQRHPDDPALMQGGWQQHPDQRIGTDEDPYLDRWFVVEKNNWPFGFIGRALPAGAPIWMHVAAKKFSETFAINIYLHHFQRSDDDRALHDHPWWFNASWILEGEYDEITFWGKPPRVLPSKRYEPRGVNGWMTTNAPPLAHPKRRREGGFYFRWGPSPHRVVLLPRFLRGSWKRKISGGERPVWTLFITGPYKQTWGFYCPQRWIHWKAFTSQDGSKGAGCDAPEEV